MRPSTYPAEVDDSRGDVDVHEEVDDHGPHIARHVVGDHLLVDCNPVGAGKRRAGEQKPVKECRELLRASNSTEELL